MPLGDIDRIQVRDHPDAQLRRESFAFSVAWKKFQSGDAAIPESMSPSQFLEKWKIVSDEMKRRGIKGSFAPPRLLGDLRESASPLYVFRPVENAEEIAEWAKSQGFEETVRPGEMHVTVLYSKQAVDPASLGGPQSESITISGGERSVEPLGDEGAVVLKIQSEELQARHSACVSAGASHDYESYLPHLTLSYKAEGVDLQSIEPFTGDIVLGPEEFEDLDRDWSPDEIEHVQESLKPSPLDEFWYTIKDRKAEKTSDPGGDARQIPSRLRKWSIIVARRGGENRARVITAGSRGEMIRRTKQEARRLKDPSVIVTGGEMLALGPQGERLFKAITSWTWKGRIVESVTEGVVLSPEQSSVLQAVIHAISLGGGVGPDQLAVLQSIDFNPDRETSQDEVPELRSPMGSIAEAMASTDAEDRPRLLREAWDKHEMAYIVVAEEFFAGRLEEAKDVGISAEDVGTLVSTEWPGERTFHRLLSEDRVIFEPEEMVLERVCSGERVELPAPQEA